MYFYANGPLKIFFADFVDLYFNGQISFPHNFENH